MFEIIVNKSEMYIKRRETTVCGNSKPIQAKFKLSSDWNDMTVLALFRAGDVMTKEVLLSMNVNSDSQYEIVGMLAQRTEDGEYVCTIPWEVFTVPDVPFKIGIYGTKSDGTIFPSIWLECGYIFGHTDCDYSPTGHNSEGN